MPTISGGVVLSGGSESGTGLDSPFKWPGVPVNGGSGTFVGRAVVGSRLINTAASTQYVASSLTTPSTVTWTLVTP
ncbi:MAG: hypothetical protein ACRD0W_18050 [Acidimicrobiales bacterium]